MGERFIVTFGYLPFLGHQNIRIGQQVSFEAIYISVIAHPVVPSFLRQPPSGSSKRCRSTRSPARVHVYTAVIATLPCCSLHQGNQSDLDSTYHSRCRFNTRTRSSLSLSSLFLSSGTSHCVIVIPDISILISPFSEIAPTRATSLAMPRTR